MILIPATTGQCCCPIVNEISLASWMDCLTVASKNIQVDANISTEHLYEKCMALRKLKEF